MTEKQHQEHHAEPATDYASHEITYNGFIAGIKWTVIISAITMVLLYFLIIH